MHVKFEPFQRSYILIQRKMPIVSTLEILWNFNIFYKFHQLSSNLQDLLELSSETCMWNLSLFREDKFFHRKMLIVSTLEISWNFNIFQSSSISSNLQNIFESSSETCMWIWANSEKLTYFIEKCRQCQPFEISWNFNIISKFIKFHQLAEHIGIIIRNMHVRYEPFQRR